MAFIEKFQSRKVVRADNVRLFNNRVEQHLANGWRKVGEEKVSHMIYTSEYTQVMEYVGKQVVGG